MNKTQVYRGSIIELFYLVIIFCFKSSKPQKARKAELFNMHSETQRMVRGL